MTIKLNIDELNGELARFNAAVNNFRPYTQGFIRNTADKLAGFNSDFIKEMARVLDNMQDSKAPQLLEKADSLHKIAKQAVASFEQVDKEIANKLSSGK